VGKEVFWLAQPGTVIAIPPDDARVPIEKAYEAISHARETKRGKHRERRSVRAGLVHYRHERDIRVYDDDLQDPQHDDLEESAMDTEREHPKAGEKEEKGYLEQRW